MKKRGAVRIFLIVLVVGLSQYFFNAPQSRAYSDVAAVFLDGENPITTSLDIRISLWDAYDIRPGDILGDGSLNTSTNHYGAYQTVFTATPSQTGFLSFEVASLPVFPVLNPINSYLQLEYKPDGAPDTEYQIYDFLDDPPYQNVTRLLMDPNTVYYVTEAGPRTSWNTFLLDANNNAPTAITLQFGETLAKTLKYTLATTLFEFNDDVLVNGSLTATTGITAAGTVDFYAASVGIGTSTPQSALQVADGYYAQFSDHNAGSPPAVDCDSDAELGRQSIDTFNERLYICNGAVRGWDYVDLSD